jgi:2-oxoacid:acceptor oxidoreductase gamma subunit (pyruvate/2-ketoisovalerate family)/2-oxoacid:acceptor oxidoreductase delta subunit (pyruvate/2-ketoisovalerate family)
MIEIRGHARGGQGMVTAFEILAKVFSKLGDFQVQAFPAFGVERTGAPIQAFLRVAKSEIFNRSNIYHPHLIVVFDESLLEQVPVFDGLKPEGAVLINTDKAPAAFAGRAAHIYTVPATRISLDLGLGSKSLPIVNAAMIGALMRIFGADFNLVAPAVKQYVPAKPDANAEAARQAYQGIQGMEVEATYLVRCLNAAAPEEEPVDEALLAAAGQEEPDDFQAPFWSKPMALNKTGNWRLMMPSYVTKTPPCNANCPAGTDVRAFVRLVSEKKYSEAYELIDRHNPFPGICGRVCPHFCEQNCNRNDLDEGLNIGAIERFLGDRFSRQDRHASPIRHREKVAIIGAGPAGLTAALRLRRKGYAVTVFESLPQAGGMMRTGIPRFRLPDAVLDAEISAIEKQGVDIQLNRRVTIAALETQGFDAVITAVGSHLGTPLGLEHEHLATEGIAFLRDFKLHGNKDGIAKGDEVAIIGGGNTAIDVARTVLRLGGVPTVYYRRTITEMPAIAQEVEEAMAEGVRMEFLVAPAAIRPKGKGLLELRLQRMALGEPDASGRRRPVPVPGAEADIEVNKVVAAIGQHFDDFAFNGQKVKPQQGAISLAGALPVFCAGDMAWGGTVTEAIGSGNKVAEEVHAFLRGMPYHHQESLPEVVLPQDINYAYYLPAPRHRQAIRHPKSLYEDFTEVALPLGEDELVAEGGRCLHCGECFSCGNCFNYCPDAAILVDESGRIRIDYDYCKGCGICAHECPCSAIQFQLMEEASS